MVPERALRPDQDDRRADRAIAEIARTACRGCGSGANRNLKEPVRNGGQLNTFPELSVAFWRWAIWKPFEADNAPRRGVVAFISNRKFLTGWPYAGLRKMLRERFDRIEIIDLRGDVRTANGLVSTPIRASSTSWSYGDHNCYRRWEQRSRRGSGGPLPRLLGRRAFLAPSEARLAAQPRRRGDTIRSRHGRTWRSR